MRQVLLTGEEPDERPPLLCDVVADRSAQHRIAGLERVEDRALRDLTLDLERSPRRRCAPVSADETEARPGSCSRQRLDFHRHHRRKISDDRRPTVAAVGRGIHLPAGRAE